MTQLDPKSMDYLNTVSIETASRCNLKCTMCSHPANERKPHFMTVEDFKRIIDKLMKTKIRRLLFNMGEPLMNQNLFQMVAYAKENGFYVYISTNGQLLNERVIRQVLDSGVDALKLSIEGYTREVYEGIRVGGDFDKLFRNVVRLHQLKRQARSPLYMWIATVMMKGNEDIVEFIKFWGPYCDDVELAGLTDHIGLVQSNREKALSGNWEHRTDCPQIKPYKEISLLSNGDMVLCCVDFHARCKLGNLLEQELPEIWHSEKMAAVLEKAYGGNIPAIDPCGDCHICDYSDVLQGDLRKVGNFLHGLVKRERWDLLNEIKIHVNAAARCGGCGGEMKIGFDGVCLNCLHKEPHYGRFMLERRLRVMVAGDSFGMPRPFKMNNEIEMHHGDCYPQVLDKMLRSRFRDGEVGVINDCRRANTSLGVLYDLSNPRFGEIYLSQPDYLVIQVGNVDCFERNKHHDDFAPFPELKGKNPWIGCDDFIRITADSIKMAVTKVPHLRGVLLVNIPPIRKEASRANEATRERISRYNAQLRMFDTLPNIYVLDAYKLFYRSKQDPLASDGIHPNAQGGLLLAQLIFDKIVELEEAGR